MCGCSFVAAFSTTFDSLSICSRPLNCSHNEMKLKQNSFKTVMKQCNFETVLLRPQNAKTAVKRFSCFSQSQSV